MIQNSNSFAKLWKLIFLVTLLIVIIQLPTLANEDHDACDCSDLRYPLMSQHNDQKLISTHQSESSTSSDSLTEMNRGYHSLLDYLEYTPSTRNQGYCGNCWAWASTGCLAIDYYTQFGSTMRFSIQYLNSLLYNGNLNGDGYACCGGNIDTFTDFYTIDTNYAIPWNNINASWQDGLTICSAETTVPVDTISTLPHYTINSIDAVHGGDDGGSGDGWFPYGESKTQQINAIKSKLNANKAIYLSIYLPTENDWNVFFDFWDGVSGENESTLFDFDYANGHEQSSGGGGHAVLLAGYDDSDPNPDQHHWICLNSWGTANGVRPNGIFKLNMSMNYDLYYEGMNGNQYYSLGFHYLETYFNSNQPPIANTNGPYSGLEGETITLDGSNSLDPDGDTLHYRWDYDNNGKWDTNWLTTATTNHIWQDDHTGIIKLQVTDGALIDTATTTINVHNTAPIVNIHEPNGGETWNKCQNISWSIYDQGTTDTFYSTISYSSNNGNQWNSIFSTSTASQGINSFLMNTTLYNDTTNAMIKVNVQDDDGSNGNDISNTVFIIDNTHPTTKIMNTKSNNSNQTYLDAPFEFILNSNDTHAGINTTYYRVWYNKSWHPTQGNGSGLDNNFYIYSLNESIETEGKHYLEFYSIDNATNREPIQNKTFILHDLWSQYRHDTKNTAFSLTKTPRYSFVKWKHKLNDKILSSPAIVQKEKLFIGCMDGTIRCLNSTTGEQIWNVTTLGNIRSSPVVSDNHVYIGSTDQNMYCFNATDGDLLWNYSTGGKIFSSPTIQSNRVYIGSNNGHLYCLHAQSGTKIWEYTTNSFIYASPAISNGKIIIASANGFIYCLDENNGNIVWEYETSGRIYSSPAISNQSVILSSTEGYVYCLHLEDGDLLWRYSTMDKIISSPVIYNDKIFICSSNGWISCLNKNDGNMMWTLPVGTISFSSPAVADGKLVVGSTDGFLYCINIEQNEIMWSYDTKGAIYSSPALYNGSVFVGNDNGELYCFGHTKESSLLIEEVCMQPESVQIVNEKVNISAELHGQEIVEVKANITYPNEEYENKTMNKISNANYYLSNNYNVIGIYSYKIWATNTMGQSVCSDIFEFEIVDDTNSKPLGVKDSFFINENSILTTNNPGILANDAIDDGPVSLSCKLVNDVTNGVLSFHQDGSFTYFPNKNFVGLDQFSYRAFDGLEYSSPTIVTIKVSNETSNDNGDMNGDGGVNSADVRYLALYVCGDPQYNPLLANGDVNVDGTINSADVRYLALYVCGDPDYVPLYS